MQPVLVNKPNRSFCQVFGLFYLESCFACLSVTLHVKLVFQVKQQKVPLPVATEVSMWCLSSAHRGPC